MNESTKAGIESVVAAAKLSQAKFGGLQELLKRLADILLQGGICEHKEELIDYCEKAIDVIVKIDIPQIPNSIEPILDRFLALYAKNAVKKMIDKVCP